MRVTQTHLDFWAARKAPKWSAKVQRGKSLPLAGRPVDLIDLCVNAHAPATKVSKSATDCNNAVSLLKLVRKNLRSGAERDVVSLSEYMHNLCFVRPCDSNGPRIRYYRRWLAKIDKAHKNSHV